MSQVQERDITYSAFRLNDTSGLSLCHLREVATEAKMEICPLISMLDSLYYAED